MSKAVWNPTEPPPAGPGVTLVISGGQAGADRGGLDAARALGLAVGGWCPKGRRAEDGKVPAEYPLKEAGPGYADRTQRNVLAAEATLILAWGHPGPGSRLTSEFAARFGRPIAQIDLRSSHLSDPQKVEIIRDWLTNAARKPRSLNVAGSRESRYDGPKVRTPQPFQALCYEVVKAALAAHLKDCGR